MKKKTIFIICLLAMTSFTCISLNKIAGFSNKNSDPACDSSHPTGDCVVTATVKPPSVPTRARPTLEPTTQPAPTTNPNTPKQLPAEMSPVEETEKPSLILVNQYSDPEHYFTVNYPEGWKLFKTGKWQEICMDADKFVCFAVQISEYPKDGSLSTFLNDTYEIFKATVSDYELLNKEEILLNGYPAMMYENGYHFKKAYEQGYAVYFLDNTKRVGYQIHAVIQENMQDYDLYYETLRQMVFSFTPQE